MPARNKTPLPQDDAYLQIWKIEQDHSRTRWTVTTFFLSISFAILGLSFDPNESLAGVKLFGLSKRSKIYRTVHLLVWHCVIPAIQSIYSFPARPLA